MNKWRSFFALLTPKKVSRNNRCYINISPSGFARPAWRGAWVFVISPAYSDQLWVHSGVDCRSTARVWGLNCTWNNGKKTTHRFTIYFVCHEIFGRIFVSLLHEIRNLETTIHLFMIQSANMYRNNSCKTVGFRVPLPVNDSEIILYLRLRDLHNKLPHPSEEESYPRNTFALSKKKKNK